MTSDKWYLDEGNSDYITEWEDDGGELDTQAQRHRDYHEGRRDLTSFRDSRSSQTTPRTVGATQGYHRFGNEPPNEYPTSQPHHPYYSGHIQYTTEPASEHKVPERNYRLDLPPDGYHPPRIILRSGPRNRTSAERGVNIPVNTVRQRGFQDLDQMIPNPILHGPYRGNRESRDYLDAASLAVGGNQRPQDGQLRQVMNNYDSSWQHESRPFRAPPSQPSSTQELYRCSPSNSPFQRRRLMQYPEEDDQEISDTSSHWHESTSTTHPRRRILARNDLRRHDSDPGGLNPFSRLTPRIARMNEPPPPTSNLRAPVSRHSPAMRVVNRNGYHMELRSLLDTGNKLGHLVSKSAIDEMDLWREVDRSSILTGTTLTGRLETLGSIDLDYYLGDNRNRFTDTFHIFDDRFYKNHDVLFSPGTENNNLVGMVTCEKHGETEDERTVEWE